MRKRNEDFSLKELVNIFLPKLWLIMAISLVFGAVMAIYSKYIKDDTYTSTTKIPVIKNSSGVDYGVSDIDFANSYLETYVEALTIPDFLIQVLEKFNAKGEAGAFGESYNKEGWANLTYADIKGYISASTKHDILVISVTSPNSILSYGIADAIQEVFGEKSFLAYPPEVVDLQTLQAPKAATSANSRKVLLNTVIGLAVGAVIAMIMVFLISMYDVVIHDKKKIEDNFDVPILGVIPRFITDEGKTKK